VIPLGSDATYCASLPVTGPFQVDDGVADLVTSRKEHPNETQCQKSVVRRDSQKAAGRCLIHSTHKEKA
jgi:hypothetical protein